MSMKTIKILGVIISILISLVRCSEKDGIEPDPVSPDSSDVELTDEQAAYLESLEETFIPLEDIILDNGQDVRSFLEDNDPDFLQDYPSGRPKKTMAGSPFQQKLLFLSRMYDMGNYLVDDDNHTYPSAGTNSPEQAGLAYSWGSKDYDVRQVPPTASGCMDKKIYGLDCTGMLWAMTQGSKLTVVPKYNFFVQYINTAQKWTDAFKASEDYPDLGMEDRGQLAPFLIRNGDIIFWASHVGVYLSGSIYQSNGTPNAPGCKDNLSPRRGPRMIPLNEILTYGLGPYKVFRIVHDHNFTLKVEYKDNFACGFEGQKYYDAVEMDIKVEMPEKIVTVSNIINKFPTIAPSSMEFVSGCTVSCEAGEIGQINVISGTGKVTDYTDPADGYYRFEVTLTEKFLNTGYVVTLECTDSDPIVQNGSIFDYTQHYGFVLADSAQHQPPIDEYGLFVYLTPK